MDVVILCGGKGTRAWPDTRTLPKPLLPVGDRPIVEHVMELYARQGHRRFILAAGYLGDVLAQHFVDTPHDWEVEVVDTGLETETGERVRLASRHVQGDRFFATYADGLANIDLDALLRTHEETSALGTVTTVPLPSPYGTLQTDDGGRIVDFREKPRLLQHWINAGFFVFEREALAHWKGTVLEQDVLPELSRLRRLFAYRHVGFWRSMDTFKDRAELTGLLEDADVAPWEQAVAVA